MFSFNRVNGLVAITFVWGATAMASTSLTSEFFRSYDCGNFEGAKRILGELNVSSEENRAYKIMIDAGAKLAGGSRDERLLDDLYLAHGIFERHGATEEMVKTETEIARMLLATQRIAEGRELINCVLSYMEETEQFDGSGYLVAAYGVLLCNDEDVFAYLDKARSSYQAVGDAEGELRAEALQGLALLISGESKAGLELTLATQMKTVPASATQAYDVTMVALAYYHTTNATDEQGLYQAALADRLIDPLLAAFVENNFIEPMSSQTAGSTPGQRSGLDPPDPPVTYPKPFASTSKAGGPTASTLSGLEPPDPPVTYPKPFANTGKAGGPTTSTLSDLDPPDPPVTYPKP